MWTLAMLLGLGPRLVRTLLLELALVWCGVWICVNSGGFGGALAALMLFLFAYPARRRSIMESWAPRAVTEWMIAHGVWSRSRLAAGNLLEILVLSLNRSAAWFVLWRSGSGRTDEPEFTCVRIAFALLLLHCLVSVYLNWNESSRIPPSLKAPSIPDKDIASIVHLALVLMPPIAFMATMVMTKGRWFPGLIPASLAVAAMNGWIISGVEPICIEGGFERTRVHRSWIRRRALSPTFGLLWEGTRPIVRWIAVAVLLACVCVRLFPFDLGEHRFAAHGCSGLALIMAAGLVQFRWSSWGRSAEFLVATGARLTNARRYELYAGLLISFEMILTGAILTPDSVGSFNFWFGYSLLIGSVLWLCNHARLVRIGRKDVRVRDLFPWIVAALFTYVLSALVLVENAFSIVTEGLSSPRVVRISPVEALIAVGPFVLFLVGAIGLWVLAFVETLNDEGLRRAELDPSAR